MLLPDAVVGAGLASGGLATINCIISRRASFGG